jgi:protocatechuate 3,4-dioxygenase beta subunit
MGAVLTGLLLWRPAAAQSTDPLKWVDPPGEESEAIRALIEQAKKALNSGASPSAILTNRTYDSVHAYPRFRQVMRDNASSPLNLVAEDETGERAVVRLRVLSAEGRPVANALVYVYHTSAKGWYSDRGYHIRANSGDERHARLFGYLRTNPEGYVEFKTVRPAGYPDGNLPAHFHVEVLEPAGGPITEVVFIDDPRLTTDAKENSKRQGFFVATPAKDSDGIWRINAEFQLRS